MRTEEIACRIVARAVDVGFSPPPLAFRVRLAMEGAQGAVFVQSVPVGPIGRAAEWLEPYAPTRLEFGPGHVMRADFDAMPSAWRETFADVTLEMLHLEPAGSAVASVVGSRAAVARFASRVDSLSHSLSVRQLGRARPSTRLLTPAQDAAIRAAIQQGYYDVPRPINLHDLAKMLGVSSASLSERLRRAEGRIVRHYAAGSDEAWRMER